MSQTIGPGERHVYRLSLEAGDAIDVEVHQQGADVVLTLFDPEGDPIVKTDSPNWTIGPERLFAVAERDGTHWLALEPWSVTGAGGCSVVVRNGGPAGPRQRLNAEASRWLSRGDRFAAGEESDRLTRAVDPYRQALRLWQRTGERRLEIVTRWKLGELLLRVGDTEGAREHLGVARGLLAQEEAPDLEPVVHIYWARTLDRVGEPTAALQSYEEALSAAQEVGNSRAGNIALNDLALIAKDRGQTWKALSLFEEAAEGFRALGDTASEATALRNLGELYTWVGRLPDARDAFDRARGLRGALETSSEEAYALLLQGWLEFRAGDLEKAQELLEGASAIYQRLGDRSGEVGALDRLGTVHLEEGEMDEAIELYRRALEIARDLRNRRDEGNTLNNLSEAYRAKGEPRRALDLAQQALHLLAEAEDRSAEAHAHVLAGRALLELNQPSKAAAEYGQALEMVEEMREASESPDLRSELFAQVHGYYEEYVDLLMEQGREAEALVMAERSRARTLLDLVAMRPSGDAVGSGQDRVELIARRGSVRRALRGKEAERQRFLETGATAREVEKIERETRRLLQRLERLEVEVGGLTERPVPTPLGLPEIRELLDPGTSLLVYFLGESRSYVWLLDRERLVAETVASRREVVQAVDRLRDVLPKSHQLGYSEQARTTAEAAGQLLLGPIADALDARRLAVVPDGALFHVPFAALSLGGEPLVRRHEIVVLASASVLASIRRKTAERTPAPDLLAMIADPVFESSDPRLQELRRNEEGSREPVSRSGSPADLERAVGSVGLGKLKRLRHSRREARAILSLASSATTWSAMDFEASRVRVLEEPLENYRILHFATHALLHDQHPELSGVVLSLRDERGQPVDGFLRSFEIADLDLRADLVVLSACRTALGRELRGEGIVGMPQSFVDAGVARVMVTLWGIDDEGTAELMTELYRGLLLRNLPPGAALREAQLTLLESEQWSAPYYWAPFVLQGDWRPLPAAGREP